MKVIHILDELKFSGAEIMYVDAAPIFQQLGCDLSVISTNNKLGTFAPFFKKAGYQVYHKPYPNSIIRRIRYIYNLIVFLKKNQYQVVHIHHKMWAMALCAWMAGCRSVYTYHSVFFSRTISYRYHRFLRWSTKNIFHCKFQSISDSVYEHEKKYYKNETIKVYNWYNNHRFYPAQGEEKNMARTELNIAKEALVLVSIGGCSQIKRHWEIINSLTKIIEKYPNTIYLHLGEGSVLPDEQNLVKSLQLSHIVRFCGNQVNVRKYLVAADIYIMTSKVEGISLTTIEAMACNVPAVLYDVPGLRDFNKETECAQLVEENHNQLAEKIIRLYEDKNRQKTLTDHARDLINSKFDMKSNATEIFNLYQGS